jgi:hypothetical protein
MASNIESNMAFDMAFDMASDNAIISFSKKLYSEGYPISNSLLESKSSIVFPLEKDNCPNITSLNIAYEQALSIDGGWDNRIHVKGIQSFHADYNTNHVMFKYKNDEGGDKICECIVIDKEIVRIVTMDYERHYNILMEIQKNYDPTLEKIKMLHSNGFPIHSTLLNSIMPSLALYRTPNVHNNYEAFLDARSINAGIEYAIPIPASYHQTDYSMFKYIDSDNNEKICSCVIKEGQIIHISCFDCEESGYGIFSLID